jgi:hypothetical protein
MDIANQLIEAYSNPNNNLLLPISIITFIIGYIEYIYSFVLVRKHNIAPFPIYMHTLYLAHDSTASVVFFLLAMKHNWFWLFSSASIALSIWTFFEVYNLYKAVTVERQEIWGKADNKAVTKEYAIKNIIMQLILMYVIVNYLRIFMNDVVMFKWFALTNIIMAVCPGFLWIQKSSKKGTSIGLAIVIVIGTINTFIPSGMWIQALPEYFNLPWFYIIGFISTIFSLYNLMTVIKLHKN